MLNNEKNKITYLHFIMSVLVILIHSINNDTKFERFFSIDFGIGQFAVPLFFLISGFLFFQNVGNIEDAKNKIRKRIYSLFVPFILWNLIYYAIHLFLNPGHGIDIVELMDAALKYTYNPAFWFMFQLILLSFISILLVQIVNNKQFIIIFYIILVALIISEIDIPYLNEDALIYYFSGGVFARAYYKKKALLIDKKGALYSLLVVIIMFLLNRLAFFMTKQNFIFRTSFILSIILVRLAMSFFIFYICDIIFKYRIVPKFMTQTFFLYAIHYMIVKAMIIFMRYFTYKFLLNSTFLPIEITVFLLSPIVCVTINYYLSNYMMKNFNKVYMTLIGNRK